jgi:1-acyl-sn-glycerol-3-phosphate acyltransferase
MKLFRMLPIQRSAEGAKYAQEYYERLKASIVLVPEGTRKKADGWKKGFHWFAKNNNLDPSKIIVNYKKTQPSGQPRNKADILKSYGVE